MDLKIIYGIMSDIKKHLLFKKICSTILNFGYLLLIARQQS